LLRLSFPDRFQGKNSSELGKPWDDVFFFVRLLKSLFYII
jgi:hypothetical protein